jgi:hypothetical protein
MPIQVAGNHAVYGVLQEILQSKRPGTWLFTTDVLWCDIINQWGIIHVVTSCSHAVTCFFLCVIYMIDR